MTMLNGGSTCSNGNGYLTGEMVTDPETRLFRWMRDDTRYRG